MAKHRAVPPEDISPLDFFTRWVPEMVAADAARRAKLARSDETIVFTFTESHESFTMKIDHGVVSGEAGAAHDPDLRVELDQDTWRALNRGDLNAPEALLRRRVKIHGDFVLALKLHLILG
jgi:putative sterol carrier protein